MMRYGKLKTEKLSNMSRSQITFTVTESLLQHLLQKYQIYHHI